MVDIVTVAGMGVEKATTAPQIEMRALALGYQSPPAYLGLYLRLAMMDQATSCDTLFFQGRSLNGAICLLSPKLAEGVDFPRSCYLRKVGGDLWLRVACFDDDYAFDVTT